MSYYAVKTGDLIVHNISRTEQRVYRVIGQFFGGPGEDSFFELAGLTHGSPRPSKPLDILIPVRMFEAMVQQGIIECVWREPEDD